MRLVAFTLSLVANTASAQTVDDCASFWDAPWPYYAADCDGHCVYSSGHLQCMPLGAATEPITLLTLVEDYQGSGTAVYSAWGTDDGGDNFCCFVDDSASSNIAYVDLYGMSAGIDDSLSLTYSSFDVYSPSYTYLLGGSGDDTLTGCDLADDIEGGIGEDIIYGLGSGDDLDGEGDADEIHGGGGADYIYGGASADTIEGGPGSDHIWGESGNDTIEGGLGDDIISGGDNDDTIDGGDGDDTIEGNDDNDVIRGSTGDDDIDGGRDDDIICGGAADVADTLDGGEDGDDVLWSPCDGECANGYLYGAGTHTCGDNACCGDWADLGTASCTYSLSTRPAACNF